MYYKINNTWSLRFLYSLKRAQENNSINENMNISYGYINTNVLIYNISCSFLLEKALCRIFLMKKSRITCFGGTCCDGQFCLAAIVIPQFYYVNKKYSTTY